MPKAVLDSSALLAVIENEPGQDSVIPYLDGGLVSAVNIAEVITKLLHRGAPQAKVEQILENLPIIHCDLDQRLAADTGFLTPHTKSYGLSLGDRACLALGIAKNLPVLTADKAWSKVDLDDEVQVIRSS